MNTQRRAAALLAAASAAIAGLFLGGCADGSSDAKSPPEKTVGTTVSRTPNAQHAEAVDAYRAMWGDLAAAAQTSDAKYPRLEAHASGEALELLRYMMTQDRKKDVVTKGQLRLDPVAEKRDATTVVIRDCADATDWLHYANDGKREDDVPGGHHRVDATVRQQHGAWTVERLYIDRVGTC
ncbi:hypothetical protein ACFC8N_16850 [Streptomyces sp. NPDC055966]|uniref:hypothetical protein n=1 Tax=Streptomyces sp. NPDC055966 TaxID=3345669 RepID=UPI0035D6AA64